MLDNLMIFCTYHNEEQINEYNLNNLPNYITLFNAANTNIEGNNINHLNEYFCEVCTMYYVWKNKLYTNYDYVGFCHYRRFFYNIDLSLCDNNLYNAFRPMTFYNLDNLFAEFDFDIVNRLYQYLLSLNMFDENFLHKYFNNELRLYNLPGTLSYIMNSNMFNNFCNIAFGFLNTLWENWDQQDEQFYLTYLEEHILDYDSITTFNPKRICAITCEYAFAIILSIMANNADVYLRNDVNIVLKDRTITKEQLYSGDVYEQLVKFYHNNVKISNNIYITTNEFKYVVIFHNLRNNDFQLLHTAQDFNNHIELSINEYIEAKDPLHFLNGDYVIKTIDN